MNLDELPRLDELRRYELDERTSDPNLDRLAELAARVCSAPIAVISTVDDTQERFLARWGVPASVGNGIPREESICVYAIERPEVVTVLEHLQGDPRFGRLPLVVGLGLSFYASASLITPGGYVLGTVCVVDERQRTLAPGEARGLQLVRDQIMELLEARRELGELRRSEALRQEAVEALMATQQDLSRRIELRTREIAAAHHKTRQILERIGDAYTVLDDDARFVYVNRRAAEIFGRSAEELIGQEIWSAFPGGGGVLRQPYEQARREQKLVTVEVCYAPWGRWFEGRIYPSAEGVAMVFTEVTERRRAEEETKKTQRRLVEAQRVAHIGSWEWNVAANEVVWSDELYRIYALPLGAPLGGYEGFLARVHPDDLERTKQTIATAIENGAPFIYDHRIVRPDGSVRMLHTRGEAINADGKLARLVGCCWDVTELDEATHAQKRSKALLEAALQATSDLVVIVDAAGNVADKSRAFAALDADAAAALVAHARAHDAADDRVDTVALADGRRVEARSRACIVDGASAGRAWSFRFPARA